ncbi:MAG: NAD(P)H-hydrate dehydratase [Cyanobacteria bacterium]|nr:NAD(P)H-hydrate dehydratase [Cyanobacteriota bacterium]
MRIPTTEQIRNLESSWIKKCDAQWGQVLMEIAGRGAAIRALRLWQESPGHVIIVCGRGNNGGDALVVARYLTLWGVPVSVWVVTRQKDGTDEHTKSGSTGSRKRRAASIDVAENESAQATESLMSTNESNVNQRILQSLNIPVRTIDETSIGTPYDEEGDVSDSSDPAVDRLFVGASLIVDGLFGTGLDREVEGIYARVIDSINRSGKRVLSIDMPSGVNSENGQIMGTAVRADRTVTFGYLKPGHLCHPGATLAGDLAIIDIGLPELPECKPDINLATVEVIREILPLRPLDAHKGTFGHVLTIAGSVGMAGAAMLSSMSALKIGAGVCYLATPLSVLAYLPAGEVIYRPMKETSKGSLSYEALSDLREELEKVKAVIIGPGLTTDAETSKVVCELLQEIQCPCIVDADALNALAAHGAKLPENSQDFIFTPHPGELSRLLNCNTHDIQADRVGKAIEAAQKFGCTIVLKGAKSVVANADGEVFINPTGNPGMATAGSGDVLSGIIGGLLSQRVDPFQAAVAGTYVHGRAGDLLAQELDESGITAGDLQRILPFAMTSVKEGEHSEFESTLLSSGAEYS